MENIEEFVPLIINPEYIIYMTQTNQGTNILLSNGTKIKITFKDEKSKISFDAPGKFICLKGNDLNVEIE